MDEGGETLKQTIEESPTLPNEHSVHCHDEEIVQAPDESAKTESGEGGGISDTKVILHSSYNMFSHQLESSKIEVNFCQDLD